MEGDGRITPQRIVDEDEAPLDVFALPTDPASLEGLLRQLFEEHWHEITFGPIIQGAAWEMHAAERRRRLRCSTAI